MSITVGKLKEVLQETLETLEDFEDDQKISLASNTYFINGAKYFLGISGYDGGYCDLRNLEVEEDDDEDDD